MSLKTLPLAPTETVMYTLPMGERTRQVILGLATVVLAVAGLLFIAPFPEAATEGASAAAVSLLWLLLMGAQLMAARRTHGIDRAAWITIIATDVLLFVVFLLEPPTESYFDGGEGMPLGFLLWPIVSLQGLVVLLIFSRGVLQRTSRVGFAADAAWLAVAAQALLWPIIGEPVLHLEVEPLVVMTILAQGAVASVLSGTLGALILRSDRGAHGSTLTVGIGIVALRYSSVLIYWRWMGNGIERGSWVDFVILASMVAMTWTALKSPEAARRTNGTNPMSVGPLAASWIPILMVTTVLASRSFELDEHWVGLLIVGGGVLVIRLSVELHQSGRLRKELHHQATTDPLTQLPNRLTLQAEIERADDSLCSVMIVDLDRFKTVNDQLGHDVGDELLRQVASRLGDVLGDDWLLSRVGGDEFIAASATVSATAQLRDLSEQVIRALEPTFYVAGREAWIGVSVGIATVAEGVESHELQVVADLALRQAKRAGRGEVVMSDDSLRAQAVDSLALATDLRQALDFDELFCLYQPKVDLVSGQIVGVEALVRWAHPARGVLCPAEFLDVAESTGLIARVDETVLGLAVEQLARWNVEMTGPRLTLSVNMSAWQLARTDVDEGVRRCIARAGPQVDAAQITIELTETLLIDDPTIVGRRLRRLRATGVNVSVDDFGSGFTSVAHLREFPISEVKIDRSLTNELTEKGTERSVAGAVIALAQALELDVVAEGVEQIEQADILRRLGCRLAQGFLFAPPVAVEQIDEWLREDAPFADAGRTETSDGAPIRNSPVQ